MSHRPRLALLVVGWLAWAGCSPSDGTAGPGGEGGGAVETREPATARWETVDGLVADREAPRHPADGGGRAWLAGGDEVARVGTTGRWTIVYEAGPEGVAVGGAVFFQVSPFWGWSEPWVDAGGDVPADASDRFPGYTTVTTEAEGVTLAPRAVSQMVVIAIGGRALTEGERLTIEYGAGAAGAAADRYAERGSPFWIGVDGDGDGVRGLVPDPPRVDVAPGPAARLSLLLPSTLAPGEEGRLTLAVLDATGSAGVGWEGSVELVDVPPELGLPEQIELEAADAGRRTLAFEPTAEGTFRLVARSGDGLLAISNPLVVQEGGQPILWADLHGHSGLSDGTGTPADYFRYARDVAALDVVALTDHDHWGFPFLDEHPELWEAIAEQVRAFHEPGRFVTLQGYEWTSWIHGHRHVLSFEQGEELELRSSLDPAYESPRQLWDALAGRDVLTFAHHSAGEPIPTNWEFVPDPRIEPVTEIMSVHGSSEAEDSPLRLRGGVPGNYVRDVLDRGVRFGFVGSGDSHDGHPGLAHLDRGHGGLAALLTGERTRAGVLGALRARRTYATSGARIILRASLDGHRMGTTSPAEELAEGQLVLVVRGTAPLQRIDVIRSGGVVDGRSFEPESAPFDHLESWTLDGLGPGEYAYARVVQVDGHLAWTSPFFVGGDA